MSDLTTSVSASGVVGTDWVGFLRPWSDAGILSLADLHIADRLATLADLDAVETIENRVFDTDRLSRRSLRRFITTDRDALLVVEQAGGLAGYALVAFRRGTALARLYSIAIVPEAAKGGLGRLLLGAVEREAQERGCLVLRLEVRADNAAAIRLYESTGFRPSGTRSGYYRDSPETAIVMHFQS
jgi:ribosomal-protein-alanine acetyltransferase